MELLEKIKKDFVFPVCYVASFLAILVGGNQEQKKIALNAAVKQDFEFNGFN